MKLKAKIQAKMKQQGKTETAMHTSKELNKEKKTSESSASKGNHNFPFLFKIYHVLFNRGHTTIPVFNFCSMRKGKIMLYLEILSHGGKGILAIIQDIVTCFVVYVQRCIATCFPLPPKTKSAIS